MDRNELVNEIINAISKEYRDNNDKIKNINHKIRCLESNMSNNMLFKDHIKNQNEIIMLKKQVAELNHRGIGIHQAREKVFTFFKY